MIATMERTLTINVKELQALLSSETPPVVLDVRPLAEHEEWAIPGSVHVDAYDALRRGDPWALDGFAPPTDRPVAVVCGAGKTSLIAAEQLRARRIEARSLAGGMKAWSLAWNDAVVPMRASEARVVQFRRTGKGCLSYLIGSDGEAAVVDPSLDPAVYLDTAAAHDWVITWVLETHIHADHLMRSRLLAARTGATLALPAQDRVAYPYTPIHDGDELSIGRATIRAVATPGHTLESVCFLLDNATLLTGDTLFLAGVGRPDLEADPDEARRRAHLLWRSLQRLLTLPPATTVLPGHASQAVPFDRAPLMATLAELRERIDLLRTSESAFVETVLARIPLTPPNHQRIVALNETGHFPAGDPTDLEAGGNRCAIG